jgi:hypothetical protein
VLDEAVNALRQVRHRRRGGAGGARLIVREPRQNLGDFRRIGPDGEALEQGVRRVCGQ